jgi:hypothetical protein
MVAGLPNLNFQKTSLQSTQSSLQNLLFTPNINVVASSPSSSTPATMTGTAIPTQSVSPNLSAPTDFKVAPIDFLQSSAPLGIASQIPGMLSSVIPKAVGSDQGADRIEAAETIFTGKNMLIAAGVVAAIAAFYFFK